MMTNKTKVWKFIFVKQAEKEFDKLHPQVKQRIRDFLRYRINEVKHPMDVAEKMTGPYRTFWRFRIGGYRLICKIHEKEILIVVTEIGGRGGIYKRKKPRFH